MDNLLLALDLGPHARFIIIAYLGVFLVVVGLIIGTMLNSLRQKKRLVELDAKGVRRRSDK
jgi:heme exporter protein CcmD